MLLDRFQQHLVGGEITLAGDLAQNLGVFVIVEVMPVGVEDAVTTQPERLMNLKINADRSHE